MQPKGRSPNLRNLVGLPVVRQPSGGLAGHHDLVLSGYAISHLPSQDLFEATRIVVKRQLERGFGLRRESEERKFRERFPLYRARGDMLVTAREIDAAAVRLIVAELGAMMVRPDIFQMPLSHD